MRRHRTNVEVQFIIEQRVRYNSS